MGFMKVEEIMKTDVITLIPDDTIATAVETMKTQKIRHIPIVDEDRKVIGIISDRDIKDASPSIFHRDEHLDAFQMPLKTIMKTEVITGHPFDFVEEIAALFYEHRIGCLPIIKEGKLVGIVTETDLLHTFVQLTGAHQPGSHIEVKVPNRSGMLAEVAAVFQKRNINILSALVYPDKNNQFSILVFRVQTMNPTGIITDLKNEGYEVLWPNLPGITS
jgi:acetoin utilization protein AcuB